MLEMHIRRCKMLLKNTYVLSKNGHFARLLSLDRTMPKKQK